MNIALDANEANNPNKVGIGRYAINVVSGIYKINKNEKIPVNFEVLLKNRPLNFLPDETSYWKYKVLSPKVLWTQLALPYYLYNNREKPDLLFTTSHYAPYLSKVPAVISVMDLSYLHFPELFKKDDLFKLKNWTAFSVNKARKIITISGFSKKEIMENYGVDSSKIIIAYPGVDPAVFMPVKSPKKDYILYVGTLQPRKNIIGLINAFKLIRKHHNIKLKIAGKKGWLYENIFKEATGLGLDNYVEFIDFVTDSQLVKLYQNAACFVLPSFYEGFGIPVIEAMSSGCPVVVSNSSSLPEITQNAGLTFSPDNIVDMAKKISETLTDGNFRNNIIQKGLKQAEKFKWAKTAEIIYTTLKETI